MWLKGNITLQKLKRVYCICFFGNTPTLKKWFSLVNILENCGLSMQYINAPNILLGIANPFDPDNTNNQVILILKYYLYKCRCLGDKPCIYGGTTYLKYCIKIEQITINFLFTTQKEYICKKCLPFESVLGVYNFSAVLHNIGFIN